MSSHCGAITIHEKRRGKVRRCQWCGQNIEVGEHYCKWLYFCDGERDTVYAHTECQAEWSRQASEYGEIVECDMDMDRPQQEAANEG